MFTAIILTALVLGAIIGLITHDRLWFPAFIEYVSSAMIGAWIGAMIGLAIACLIVGIPQ